MRRLPKHLLKGSDHPGVSFGERSLEHDHRPEFEPEAPAPLSSLSWRQLLMRLGNATAGWLLSKVPIGFRRFLLSFFGVCSMIAPLALWIAPSKSTWFWILGLSLFSICACYVIVVFSPEDQL